MTTHHRSLYSIRSGAGRVTGSSFKNSEDKNVLISDVCKLSSMLTVLLSDTVDMVP